MKLWVATFGAALLCACSSNKNRVSDDPNFFAQMAADDPANKPQGKTAASVSIEISVTVAEMPTQLATEVFGKADWNGLTYGMNEAPDLEALAGAHAAVEILSRPKIVARNGVKAAISDTKKFDIVKDYTVDAHGDLHPIAGVAEEGVWFEVTPHLDMTLEWLDLDYSIKRSVLQHPITEYTVVPKGANRQVTIDLPESTAHVRAGNQRLFSGQTVALDLTSMSPSDSSGRTIVVLIAVDFWNP